MKRRTKALARRLVAPLTAAALLLSSCATPTPYQPRVRGSQVGGGFSEQRLAQNRYRVTFVGNSFTSRERVENYLLFRAAELTLESGNACFTLARRGTDPRTRVTRSFRPGPWGYWGPSWRFRHRGYWRSWDPWGYDPFWGDSVDYQTVTNYQAFAEIVMSRAPCSSDAATFNAEDVTRNLGPSIEYPEAR
jgi:hypothetical protein